MRHLLVLLCLAACARSSEPEVAPVSKEPLWLLGRSGQLMGMSGELRHPFDAAALAFTRFDSYLGWAAGSGRMWHTSDAGDSWVQQAVATNASLLGLSFASPTHGVAVGEHGTVLRTDDGGAHWRAVDVGSTADLHAVKLAHSTGAAIAAGEQGTLLRSSDSGRTWSSVNVGHTDALNAVDVTDDGSLAVAVGAKGHIHLLNLSVPKADWLAVRFVGHSVLLAGQGGAAALCARECRVLSGASEDLVSIAMHPSLLLLGRSGTLYRVTDNALEPLSSLADAFALDDL